MQNHPRPVTSDGFSRAQYGSNGYSGGKNLPLNSTNSYQVPSLVPSKSFGADNGRISNQNTQAEQARVRAHSPLKVAPALDQYEAPGGLLNSAPHPGQLRRPVSQVPSMNRGFGSNLNETGSISNYDRKGISPNLMGNKGLNSFQRLDKEALREQITQRNKNVKELIMNKKFFEESLNKKNSEFKEKIRADLKAKVFDKILKSNLHYIYKHYENLKANIDRQEALKVLNSNVSKQNSEIQNSRNELSEREKNNRQVEQRLLESANRVGLIKAAPDLVENIAKEDIEIKIRDLTIENEDIEKRLIEIKKWKDKQLYDLKFKHEIKGRRLMEEKAIRLALQYVEPGDPEQLSLKQHVESILADTDQKNSIRKSNPVHQLQSKRDMLLKDLELLKFSKV